MTTKTSKTAKKSAAKPAPKKSAPKRAPLPGMTTIPGVKVGEKATLRNVRDKKLRGQKVLIKGFVLRKGTKFISGVRVQIGENVFLVAPRAFEQKEKKTEQKKAA